MALVTARASGQGLGDGVVLCSRDSHVSLVKAARVMGLADDALVFLPGNHILIIDSKSSSHFLELQKNNKEYFLCREKVKNFFRFFYSIIIVY